MNKFRSLANYTLELVHDEDNLLKKTAINNGK